MAFLSIRLDGPFAVVIKKGDSYKIRVFAPGDAMHQLWINGKRIQYNPAKDSFHFELLPDGLKPGTVWPDIDPAFDWSTKSTDTWKDDDKSYFICMDLPCPQEIRQDRTARVKFDDNSTGIMPLNHHLTYEISDAAKIQIKSPELGKQGVVNNVFQIELGLPKNTPNSQAIAHAIKFYNTLLKIFFAKLYNDPKCRLQDITKATTVECKNGGIIVGFP